jgi:hypothetical protein
MKQGLSDVLLFCDYVLGIFNSPTQIPPMKQGLKWCALLWLHVLGIFQQSYPIPTWKQDWSDVLLFVITCVGNYFSTVLPNSTYEAGIKWCAALLWLCVLEYFSTVLPNSTYKAGLSDVLLFCDSMC